MTKYIIELLKKGAKTPYETFEANLLKGYHPRYPDNNDCFNGRLKGVQRFRIRYASNNGLVGESSVDSQGRTCIKWFRS